jgi:hypothetical protein
MTPLFVDRHHKRIWQNPDIANLVHLDKDGDDQNVFRVWIKQQGKYVFTIVCKDPLLEEHYSLDEYGNMEAEKKLADYLEEKVIGFLEEQEWCSSEDRKIWNENQFEVLWSCDCVVCKLGDRYGWES